MRRITITFWALWLGLTALWLAADRTLLGAHPFAQVQLSWIFYTGIIGMGAISVSLMLALRSVVIEPYVGGLDKSYRLHKWLGLLGTAMALAHWLWISAPGWLVSLGMMAAPPRTGPRKPAPGPAWLHALQGPAKGLGQWCLWATVALVVLALLKWFPYRWFLRTHRLLAVVFLPLVFHSVVLLKFDYWHHAISYAIVALMAGGTAAALIILFRRVGRTRQAVGEVEAVTPHGNAGIFSVSVCLKDRWPGHDAGQFAFVSFDDHEEPHPFTISSGWKDDGRLVFVIKSLGDYTRDLPTRLKPGALVTLEGPYGRFNFNGKRPRQIWISGGIGITPFISRMQQLAEHPDGKTIDLFHATTERQTRVNPDLWRLASAANVRLHVWVSAEEGKLTAEQIERAVPDWKSADVWFCGPVQFGKDLKRDFTDDGLSSSAFHQELFHFR